MEKTERRKEIQKLKLKCHSKRHEIKSPRKRGENRAETILQKKKKPNLTTSPN